MLRQRAIALCLIGLTFAFMALTFVDPPYPFELRLQHVPTIVILAALLPIAWRETLSTGSFACVIAFLWLHILGARWIYSYVPYDTWAASLFGTSISEQLGWTRNHYDRLVHLASGVLLVFPFAEILQTRSRTPPWLAALLAICVVLAVGAVYEIIEWQIAIAFSPAQAEAYNGQQGDIWDPQKDLALALLGGFLSAGLACRRRFEPPKASSS